MANENAQKIIGDCEYSLQLELATVLRSNLFARSPVISKLLIYLTDQAIAGNFGLRSYQVAVEGLNRNADFDPATDSYPRVQVGRLRTTLEVYYARHPEHQGLCLHIPHGTYAVQLSRRSVAYPALVAHEQPDAAAAQGARLSRPHLVHSAADDDFDEGHVADIFHVSRPMLAGVLVGALACSLVFSAILVVVLLKTHALG